MAKASNSVFAEALRLDPDTRAELAAELLDSMDGLADPDAEAAWDAEIQRRIAAIEAGTIKLEPWETVKRRIEKENPAVVQAAWAKEIEKRGRRVLAGETSGTPWEEVRDRVARRLDDV